MAKVPKPKKPKVTTYKAKKPPKPHGVKKAKPRTTVLGS